jgi:hypothetical protein
MTAKELMDNISYTGQEVKLRKLCMDENLVPVDKLATMTCQEVCVLMGKHYELLGTNKNGEIMLVKKTKYGEIMNYVQLIGR